jgi:hypothetical protein
MECPRRAGVLREQRQAGSLRRCPGKLELRHLRKCDHQLELSQVLPAELHLRRLETRHPTIIRNNNHISNKERAEAETFGA